MSSNLLIHCNKIKVNMQLSMSQNPELEPFDSISYSSIMRKSQGDINNKASFFQQCKAILKKSYDTRSVNENSKLLKLIEKADFLKDGSDTISPEFIKGLLRNAKIQMVEQRQVIVEEQHSIDYMVILLEGKMGIRQSSFSPNITATTQIDCIMSYPNLFEKLTLVAKKERDQLRKATRLQRKSTLPVSQYQFVPPILSQNDYYIAKQNIERNILAGESYGARERLLSKVYKNQVIAVEPSAILIIEISFLFYWLQVAFRTKLSKNIELMKAIPVFQTLQDQKLSEIIFNMKLTHKRKNDIIYHQGDSAQMLYVLVQGEVKLSKQATLFQQNPNDLYVDRRHLIKKLQGEDRYAQISKSLHKDSDVLRFADLTTLYNYRPLKKDINIGIISSFGLFGEEELVFRTTRQTTAQVSGIEASYYQLQFKKLLEVVGVKNVDRFKQSFEKSIRKKVLYRQSQFAEHIDFQNRTHMDYFYLDEGKVSETTNRRTLDKINERMAPKILRDTINHAQPFYTSFNFHKMTGQRKKELKSPLSRKHNQSRESLKNSKYNQQEKAMVGISHTWSTIQRKVEQQRLLSHRISPLKHEINIYEPLIDQQFFRDVASQHRRINKQFRTVRLSLGKNNL